MTKHAHRNCVAAFGNCHRAVPDSILVAALAVRMATYILPAMGSETNAVAQTRLARIERVYRERIGTYVGRDDVLVRPGLLAFRQTHQVLVDAEATGIKPGETAEFLLIGPGSGHAYEALALSDADGDAVKAALEFIGMQAGTPYRPDLLRFWPKGERVLVDIARTGTTNAAPAVRAESIILDKRTRHTLRPAGFVFTGSTLVDDPEQTGRKVLAATAQDPRAIVCAYNETQTVLDVPRQAVKGEVYEHQAVSATWFAAAGAPLQIRMTPEYTNGRVRVVDMALAAAPATNAATGLASLSLTLSAGARILYADADVNRMLEIFVNTVSAGQDPFVSVRLGDDLTVASAQALCRLLMSVETETGIRVEPPPEGQLYYRAFAPNETLRQRTARTAQPWELRLSVTGGVVKATVTEVEQVWSKDRLQPDLKTASTPVASPEALRAHLSTHTGLPVILVFADPALRLRDLMRFLQPVRKTHPTVHVYTGNAE